MEQSRKMWTISSLLAWTIKYFQSKNIASARLDAEVLLAHLLGQKRIYLYVHFDEPLQEEELSKFHDYVVKRANHMPVAYIIGEKEFMGLPFKVTRDTLIPRPDTEILVEHTLAQLDKEQEITIADIGTGSGAIILSLLANLPKAYGTAVDISPKALAVAKENAQSLEVIDRCDFAFGDLLSPLTDKKFDVIVSNPPYIPQADMAGLERDVKDYEPHSALTDNGDGLSFYRRLWSEASAYLNAGGFLAVEIGIHEAVAVKQFAEENNWQNVQIIKDYAGIDRVVMAWKQN